MSHSQIINQQSILRIETQVLPGNKLEINLPVETTGKIVEVLVLLPESKKNPRRSVMDILREIRGKGIFSSPEEANQHLQKERSEWEL